MTKMIKRYAPKSVWKLDGKSPVSFAFTYATREEAEKEGRDAEEKYGDQIFQDVEEVMVKDAPCYH